MEQEKIRQNDPDLEIHQLWRPQGDSNPCRRRERAKKGKKRDNRLHEDKEKK